MHVVVSAFEPFGGRPSNRSLSAATLLAGKRGVPTWAVLPVRFARLTEAVDRVIATKPDFWLMLGESWSASALCLETTAVNLISARIPDNDGAQPRRQRVEQGPPRRKTAIGINALVRAIDQSGVPVERSENAGRFACNAAYYLALARLGARRVLFVHVPADADRLADAPLLEGLRQIIRSRRR